VNAEFGLKPETVAQIRSVFVRHPEIDQTILYGSRAKGNYKHGSDIDLTLIGGETLSADTLYRIAHELDDLLLPYSFDLSLHAHLQNPDILDHIRRVGVPFYVKSS
jgi:uncharacterized protein